MISFFLNGHFQSEAFCKKKSSKGFMTEVTLCFFLVVKTAMNTNCQRPGQYGWSRKKLFFKISCSHHFTSIMLELIFKKLKVKHHPSFVSLTHQ